MLRLGPARQRGPAGAVRRLAAAAVAL